MMDLSSVAKTRAVLLLPAAIFTLAIGAVCVFLVDRMLNVPIGFVNVEGVLDEREMMLVRQKLSGQELSKVSIRELKPILEEMGWVHHVNLKKVWPDVLQVQVTRQKAVAKWNAASYLNGEGRLFTAELKMAEKLPGLNGPEGAEKLVMAQFQQLNKAFQKTGLTIRRLTLEERGEWVLQLQNAVVVKLGKDNMFQRVQRLTKIYEAVGLAEEITGIAEIDTRYPNGVAVRWKDVECITDCNEFAGNIKIKRKQTL
jgi:cell division protein FtsQ